MVTADKNSPTELRVSCRGAVAQLNRCLVDAALIVLLVLLFKTCADAIEQTPVVRAAGTRFSLWRATQRDPRPGTEVGLTGLVPLVEHPTLRAETKPAGNVLLMMSACDS